MFFSIIMMLSRTYEAKRFLKKNNSKNKLTNKNFKGNRRMQTKNMNKNKNDFQTIEFEIFSDTDRDTHLSTIHRHYFRKSVFFNQ